MSQENKPLGWLRDVDQIGVPVSMSYQGGSTKSTRCGGAVSLVGSALVIMFIIGTISMYMAFSNVSTNTSNSGLNPLKMLDCTASGNQCMQLNGTQYMPFVFLNGASDQTIAVPEFYATNIDVNGN